MQRLCVQNGLVSEFHQEKKLEMKKVFIRTFTGLFIVIAVYAIIFLSKYPFVIEAATALLSVAAVYEIFRATGENQKKAPLFISLSVAAIVSFVPIPHYEVFACVTLIVAIFVFAAMMRKMETFRFYRTRQSVVMALIVVLLIRAIPTLRAVENGCLYLAFTITICFLSDILAYLTGKLFGTHRFYDCPCDWTCCVNGKKRQNNISVKATCSLVGACRYRGAVWRSVDVGHQAHMWNQGLRKDLSRTRRCA